MNHFLVFIQDRCKSVNLIYCEGEDDSGHAWNAWMKFSGRRIPGMRSRDCQRPRTRRLAFSLSFTLKRAFHFSKDDRNLPRGPSDWRQSCQRASFPGFLHVHEIFEASAAHVR